MKSLGILRVDLKTIRFPMVFCVLYYIALFFWPTPYLVDVVKQGVNLAVMTKVYIAIQYFPAVLIAFVTSMQYEETFRTPSKEYLHVLKTGIPRLLILRPALTVAVVLLFNVPLALHTRELLNDNLRQILEQRSAWGQPISFSGMQVFLQCVSAELFAFALCLLLLCLTGSKSITLVVLFAYFALEAGGVATVIGQASPFCNAFFGTVNYRDMPGDNAFVALGIFAVCYVMVLIAYRFFSKRR